MGWQDRQYERIETVLPFIQWVNSGANLEPRSEVGGFAQPLDQAQILGVNIPGEVRVLHHKGGKTTDVVFNTELVIAVLTTRFGWVKNGRMLSAYESGARGKLQALCLVRDADKVAGPVILTFTGLAGSEFNAALSVHRETVRKATAASAPAYAFFGVFRSGGIKMVGNGSQSPITTVEYGEGFDPDAAFVGDEALDALNWAQIEAWESAWQQNGSSYDDDGAGANGNSAAQQSQPKPKNPTAPASESQRGLIRRLMAELGIEGEKQNKALRKRTGYDPKTLTMEQASDVIQRLMSAKESRNGDDASADNGDDASIAATPDPTRATAEQWGMIRVLMTDLGIEGENKQNKALQKQTGYNPNTLTVSQAAEVIERLTRARSKARS